MKKNKFITSTIILIISGFATKIISMIIKIVLTRMISTEGIGLYMLILPTFMLFITIASFGLPVTISKIVAEDKKNNRRLILSIIPLIIIFNLGLMIILLLISPILSKYLLNSPKTYYPLIAIGLTLPFISISGMIRGYFFGKGKIIPHVISHIMEQIIRLIVIVLVIPYLLKISLESAITGIVLINIISELVSILILIGYLPKNFKITKKDFTIDKSDLKDVLDISIPNTGSRLIGSFGYFLEPIIVTNMLLLVGYSSNYIITEYGILNGYVLPLLMIPSFFTGAISSALLPVISNSYANNKITYTKTKIKQAVLISMIIGIIVTIIIMMYPAFFLKLIYNTNQGSKYLMLMAPFFLLYYIQMPLTTVLQAINRSKAAMFDTLKGIIIKTLLLLILAFLKIGMYGLIIASIANIIIVTISHYQNIKKYLK